MIKTLLIFSILSTFSFANTALLPASKVEIKKGKKIYYPIEKVVIQKTLSKEVIKFTVNKPVLKAFSIDYVSSN